MPQLPADLPGLQEEAERLAKEQWQALNTARNPDSGPGYWHPETAHLANVVAQVNLLRDLTRQASRDWAMRWLATHAIPHATVGPFEGPAWYKYQNRWVLWFGDHSSQFADSQKLAEKWRVHGIGAIENPAEALAMVCTHVAKVPDGR